MAQKPIELILMRQLASSLATPIFLVDAHGTLVFYNESAQDILGHRFEESGEMTLEEWSSAYGAIDEDGNPFPKEKFPLVIALNTHRAAHVGFWITGKDHVRRHIEVSAIPLMGHGDDVLGAFSIFWEGLRK